jgi:hypothetical protein
MKKTAFDPELLMQMGKHVLIPSKEPGDDPELGVSQILRPFDPFLATQVYVAERMKAGIARGIHTFYILKCRQSGITTEGVLILLMWNFKHDGMVSNFIADNSSRVSRNRRLTVQFVKSLEKHPEWRQEIDDNNREVLSFLNGSEINWQNANSQDEGGLGKSIGSICNWATEIGRYRDEKGLLSLTSSMSENSPLALNVFEGTSEGPNLFKELYDDAARVGNTSAEAIFIPWWIHPWYEHDLKNPEHKKRFEAYWLPCPRLTRDETRWVEGVRVRYNYEIRPTQLSWWRWHLSEKKKKNILLMYQEYPAIPEDAWTYGGRGFIDGHKLSVQITRVIKDRARPKRFFVFDPGDGVNFESSDLEEVDPESHYYDLVCFCDPIDGPNVRYCLGWDPSHGANEEGDNCCGQVLCAWLDKAVQVAEFSRNEIPTYQQAWVILHLVGAYSTSYAETHLNIEMQGGGTQIYDEIKKLQASAAYGYSDKLVRYFSRMSHYQYVKFDSTAGRGSTVHWETSWRTRGPMLHNLKNMVSRDMLELHSADAIRECERATMLRNGDIDTGDDDHRVLALAIACMAYAQLQDVDTLSLSTDQKQVSEMPEGGILDPGQIMQHAINDWRNRIKQEVLEENEGFSETPDWLQAVQAEAREEQNWFE